MSSLLSTFNLSTGRKYLMGLSGLFLCLFLVEHLYTNLLLYVGDGGALFEETSHSMVNNIFIRIIEIVLFAAIIIHVYEALVLTRQNAAARPVKYAVNKSESNSSWYSRNMGLTGSVIFFFLVVHLKTFFVPYRVTHTIGGEGQESVAYEVTEVFGNVWYSALYLVAAILLAFHLNHGFQSAFQSLGANNKKYAPLLRNFGTGFAVIMGIGFASFPILFYLAELNGWDILNWNNCAAAASEFCHH